MSGLASVKKKVQARRSKWVWKVIVDMLLRPKDFDICVPSTIVLLCMATQKGKDPVPLMKRERRIGLAALASRQTC